MASLTRRSIISSGAAALGVATLGSHFTEASGKPPTVTTQWMLLRASPDTQNALISLIQSHVHGKGVVFSESEPVVPDAGVWPFGKLSAVDALRGHSGVSVVPETDGCFAWSPGKKFDIYAFEDARTVPSKDGLAHFKTGSVGYVILDSTPLDGTTVVSVSASHVMGGYDYFGDTPLPYIDQITSNGIARMRRGDQMVMWTKMSSVRVGDAAVSGLHLFSATLS